jgi:hypothetical protein
MERAFNKLDGADFPADSKRDNSGRPISRSYDEMGRTITSASNFARETSVPNTDRAIHKLRVDVVVGA